MPRLDLMALTPDDLVTLSNRGIVKRAQQEMGTMAGTYAEDAAGNVTAQWPAETVECVIPAKGGVPAATCTCPATTLCRHIIRSVFLYQQSQTASVPESTEDQSDRSDPTDPTDLSVSLPEGGLAGPQPILPPRSLDTPLPRGTSELGEVRAPEGPGVSASWDPGSITDNELAAHVSRTSLSKARKLFDAGQVVELVRSTKPTARLHSLSSNVRFLVPGDIGYTYCDCAETQPCTHVPIAVWAFRLLEPDADGGTVSTHGEQLAVPAGIMDDAESAMRDLLISGFSNLSQSEVVRLRRIEEHLRSAALVWPAEIVSELVALHDAYAAGDARFAPIRLPELIGELLVRFDAIRNDTGAVPQLFIRGSASDRTTEIGSARLIGLGCGVHVRRHAAQLSAYMQDMDSGMTVAVTRLRVDPAPDSGELSRTFAELALAPVVRGSNMHNLGFGQLLVKGGKRTASCEFMPGRSPLVYSPQSYRWERLRPPLYAEDFAELRARIAAQPPASLLPRRVAGGLSVCAVDSVAAVRFDSGAQVLEAILVDRAGQTAQLTFPYYVRNAGGFDRLAQYLRDPENVPRFISGEFRIGPAGLTVVPVAIVFERDGNRAMLQPWVDAAPTKEAGDAARQPAATAPPLQSHEVAYVDDVLESLSDLYQVGLTRLAPNVARLWADLASRASAAGLSRLSSPIVRVARRLEERESHLNWDPQTAADTIVDLTAVVRVAVDVM